MSRHINRQCSQRKGLLALSLFTALYAIPQVSHAQTPGTTLPNLPPPPTTTVAAPAAVPTPVVAADPNAIAININGVVVPSNPAPLLEAGTVYVPLRGVLENLGAKVNYVAADNRIDIQQNGRLIVLRPGTPGAIVDLQAVELAAPKLIAGRAFVPLRALAEIFGYGVNWLGPSRTVQITADRAIPADHRAALEAAGRYGVLIDIHRFGPEKIPELLDAAKEAGAGLVKVKFDWNTLEPSKGAAFDWTLYDQFLAEARKRKLVVTGIFGDTALWAATFSGSDPNTTRRSPPKESEFPAWSNYVKRVVGRYKNDVHAWQVWVNPSATNFLTAKAANYRKLARTAIEAAKSSDPKSIVHVAETGGADLQIANDFLANGLTPISDGIAVYPVASWQQGSVAQPEEIVRPYSVMRGMEISKDSKRRDYWFAGLGFPVATQVDEIKNGEAETRSVRLFTPQAQADYLVKTTALGLALGAEKVFAGNLRDTPETPVTNGIKLENGLQNPEGEARPAFTALQTISKVVGNKPYAGQLSFNSKVIALLFDDKKTGVIVAWSPRGDGVLHLGATGTIIRVPNAVSVDTLPDSQILNVTGEVLTAPSPSIKLTSSPIFITNISLTTAQEAATRTVRPGVLEDETPYAGVESVSTQFGAKSPEKGLFWRKYKDFPSEAQTVIEVEKGVFGLATEPQRDVFDLRSSKPFIHFDVADDFVFNDSGGQFELIIEVKKPQPNADPSGLTVSSAGFRVEYDSTTGDRNSVYQVVEPGEGLATITIPLTDVQFANANGFDFVINSAGAKQPLYFTSVTLKKITPEIQNP
jgi:hypothetical protein